MSYLSDLLDCHGNVPAICSNVCSLQKRGRWSSPVGGPLSSLNSCIHIFVIRDRANLHASSGGLKSLASQNSTEELTRIRFCYGATISSYGSESELQLQVGATCQLCTCSYLELRLTPQLIVDSRVDRNLRHYHTNVGTFYLLINLILSVSQDFALKCEFN